MIDNSEKNDVANIAREVFNDGISKEQLNETLQKKGYDKSFIDLITVEYKKLYYTKRRGRGVLLFAIGGFILMVGCVITLLLMQKNESITFVMYGLTTIGSILVLAGIVDIFGW